jgi:hypothetical protein
MLTPYHARRLERAALESALAAAYRKCRGGFARSFPSIVPLTRGSSHLLSRARRVLREINATAAMIGWFDTFLYVTSRGLSAISGNRVRIIKYYFMSQPIGAETTRSAARARSFTIAFTGPGSALFSQVARPVAVIDARFAQGARCLAATDGQGQFAGFLWFVIGAYDEDEVRVRFEPRPRGMTAWDFDVSIVPRYRLSRLFAYLWERASVELASCGVRHSLSRISAFNGASLSSHRRLGARSVGDAVFFCMGSVQLMRSTLASGWHLSWREDQRPVLSIEA